MTQRKDPPDRANAAPEAPDGDAPEQESAARGVDPRMLAAWREWLRALETNAEAALAAAHVYDALAPSARDAWLDALAEDVPRVGVPVLAVYAPLLAFETDPARRARIEAALSGAFHTLRERRAYRGIAEDGSRVAALVAPVYLRFVTVLSCRYHPDTGFVWARHEPILNEAAAPGHGSRIDDVALEATPLKPVVEELAHAVLAQNRSGKELPGPLRTFADLFDAKPDAEEP